ncbi:UQCRB [Bugula neritina]|uniref:Cytochrome b-c1 complex subunit 7 n=1 Tax=Bugula neritina TaxID=10212 RepID=A0A7J7J1G3_BUGNE|nr:UQCRB [Bugula neritina]
MSVVDPLAQLRRWYYYRSYFPQLGLRADDVLNPDLPEVKEAVRRLPRDAFYEREFRISRALKLSLEKNILPKEEWTEYEKDEPYLKPYIDDIKAEWEEKAWWGKLN